MTTAELDAAYRPTLFAIAYRMTGEVMTSQDLVQDALLNGMNRSSRT